MADNERLRQEQILHEALGRGYLRRTEDPDGNIAPFDTLTSIGSGRYETPSIFGHDSSTKDFAHQLGGMLGLSGDQILQSVARNAADHFNRFNSFFTEGSSPRGVQQGIADHLFLLAGQPNPGIFTPEELAASEAFARDRQEAAKASDRRGGFLGGFGMLSGLAGIIPGPWQPFALGLSTLNALDQGNLIGAAASGLGAFGINPIGDFGTELGVPSWLANSIGSTGIGMLSGQKFEDALRNAAIGTGFGFAGNELGRMYEQLTGDPVAEVGQSAYNIDELFADTALIDDPLKRRRIQVADASGAVPIFSTPAVTTFDAQGNPVSSTPAMTQMQAPGMLPTMVPTSSVPMMPSLSSPQQEEIQKPAPLTPEEIEADIRNRRILEAGDVLGQPAPSDLSRYGKIARHLYEMLGEQERSLHGAPQRQEDMTPEEEQAYFAEVVQYLGLDPATMAEAGLTPGSPEYLEYILQQIDAIIGQVIGDANPDGEDFGALLRTKTAQELGALNRAIYIRGQIGSLVGPGRYADPFTGMLEDVAAPSVDARFRPGVAAWQRGLARSAEELAGLRGQEAKRFLGGMLDRRSDIYGMQARRDAQALREALESREMDDIKRRRRGMFGDDTFFQQELESMNAIDLDRMLALLMGRDAERQGAAVEELFGWRGI